MLDQALVLRFKAPASFTGEDGAELHVHGGRAVVAGVSDALERLGLRQALPGEFTRRAFEHGKLDLLQAEAVADLVDAETESQRRQALDDLDGALSGRVAGWRETLLDTLSVLEAEIDFPEEEVPEDVSARALPSLKTLRVDLAAAIADRRAEQIRDGFKVALVGPPNAGKSSLFNALLGRDAAIVTPVAGTTRDVIEARWKLDGRLILLADTAGDRDAEDVIEREGVRRARGWAAMADLRVHLVGPEDRGPDIEAGSADLIVRSKADLSCSREIAACSDTAVSAKTGDGIGTLRSLISRHMRGNATGGAGLTRPRHRNQVTAALDHLDRALMSWPSGPEIRAENIRLALTALTGLVGRSGVEDVLDRLFAEFCIGK